MHLEKHLPLVGATAALLMAFLAFWTAPALTASLALTFVSAPLALVCAIFGSSRIALMGIYFSLSAWLPFWLSRQGVADFGSVFTALLIAGAALAVVLILEAKMRAIAT